MCARCGAETDASFAFCPYCGCSLGGELPQLVFGDPLIGAVIAGRYRLLTRLGKGGMGTVYKVEHVHMDKLMAMKLLHGDLSRDETMVRRFTREARAVSRLRGPHTAEIFDFGNADGLFYIVMEFLRGLDLGELLVQRRSLSPLRTAHIVRQIADGLAEAHAQNIVHRDLKPENIFVCASTASDDETIKILDFGLAKLQKREDSLIHTQRGLILGTPHYMSPEQVEGEDVGLRSDLYSLGAVVWRMLAGAPPYPGDNILRVLNAHTSAPLPRIGEVAPELRFLDEFFSRALAKRAEERFGSARELADIFELMVLEHDQLGSGATLRFAMPAAEPRADESDRLLPRFEVGDDGKRLATAADFDRFEWRLRVRRVAAVMLTLGAIAAAVWFVVWGVVQGNLYDSSAEQEPNDTLKEATELRAGAPRLGTIGVVSESQRADRDVYRITDVEAGRMLRVRVTSVPGIDLMLELVDARGKLLYSQDAAPAAYGEIVPDFPHDHGELYVIVREVWRQGQAARAAPDLYYAIILESRPPLSGEEREPNDTLEQASSFARGTAHGIIDSLADVDRYRLPTIAGGRQRFEVRLSGVPFTDLELALLDSTGARLARVDDHGLEVGEGWSLTLAADQVNQPLYLEVRSTRGYSTESHYVLEYALEPLR